jgi:hypothetical protein
MITIIKLIICMVFVKYLLEFIHFISLYFIFFIHEPYIKPNNHIVIAPPLVIAFIPHRHIDQFNIQKND